MLKDSVIGKLLNRLMEVPEADIPGVLSENQLGISDTLEFDTLEDAFASSTFSDSAFWTPIFGYPFEPILTAQS